MTFFIFNRAKLCAIAIALILLTSAQSNLFSFNPPNSSISLICPADITVGIYGNSCAATVQLLMPQIQMANCNGNPSFFISSPFGLGLGPHHNVPAGTYKINYRAVSPCGDSATCSSFIHILDKKKPVPVFVTALYTTLLQGASVKVRAWQFNQGSFDNCSNGNGLRFTFSPNPKDTVRTFSCADLGMNNISITVWDQADNFSEKITKIGILDNEGFCTDNTLQGKIETTSGRAMQETEVEIQGNGILNQVQTDEQGFFSVQDLDPSAAYTIKPRKNNDYLNGVNPYDLYTLHQHLTGYHPFTNPYQYIAADINRDGLVSVSDLMLLQECILGIQQGFPNNNSWRFLDKNYVFSDITKPLQELFPESIVSQPQNGNRRADFWAIKTGDIDMGTALSNAQITDERQGAETISVTVQQISNGKLALKLNIPKHLRAFEGTISADAAFLNLISAESNNPSLKTAIFSNNLKFTWYHTDGTQLHSAIIFLTISPGTVPIKEGHYTLREPKNYALGKEGIMYQASFNLTAPQTAMTATPSALRAYPNSPNPFMEFTMLPFSTNVATDVRVCIFNAAGQMVHEIPAASYEAGEHRILLLRKALQEPGVYTCRFESKAGSASRKLMLL